MRVKLVGIPTEQHKAARQAIKMVDRLVWGNEMKKKVQKITVIKNSKGNPLDAPIFKGILDVYNHKTKSCVLHIQALIEMGANDDGNLAWSICHDLSHAFDVAHKNLIFDTKNKTLIYLGKTYDFKKPAVHLIDEEFAKKNRYRDSRYYAAHDFYEPWEVRPLMAADACMAEIRRKDCPNLLKEAA